MAAASVASLTYALPEDKFQAIEISAERAYRDDKAGFTVYSGDVILEQGTLTIEAEKLTIFHDREAADRIIAVGEPARMRQQPELEKGFVTASAGRIIYEKSRERILLRIDASIEQDGAIVSGESIDYFMAQQRVRANASKDDADARVQVTIPAEVVEAQSAEQDESSTAEPDTTTEPPLDSDAPGRPAPPSTDSEANGNP
ncbi:MAG: hypothetical protein Cons2KO_23210 [Congregibacter sp.]